MRPSIALELRRTAIREVVSRFRTANPRVFGSVLSGTDQDGGDLDLLVDALPGATLLDLGDLQDALKSLLAHLCHHFAGFGFWTDVTPCQH